MGKKHDYGFGLLLLYSNAFWHIIYFNISTSVYTHDDGHFLFLGRWDLVHKVRNHYFSSPKASVLSFTSSASEVASFPLLFFHRMLSFFCHEVWERCQVYQ